MGFLPEKDFIFILRSNEPYGSQEIELTAPPQGWSNYAAQWMLDQKYFGYGRKMLIQLQFVKEGADFLQEQYDNFGVTANVQLIVNRLNRKTFQYYVDSTFDVDFQQFKSERDFVEVGFAETGIKAIIKAKEKTTYDIPMIDGEDVLVPEGINLREFVKYNIGINLSPTPTEASEKFNMKLNDAIVETYNFIYGEQTETEYWIGNEDDEENLFLKINPPLTEESTIDFEIEIFGNIKLSSSYEGYFSNTNFYLVVKKTNGTEESYFIETFNNNENNQSIEIRLKKVIQITLNQECEGIYLQYKTSKSTRSFLVCEAIFTMNYFGLFTTPPFTLKAFQIKDWLQKICNRMGNIEVSDEWNFFLSQCHNKIMVTSADAIRGITNDNNEYIATGKGCFLDFFDSLDAVMNIGMFFMGDNKLSWGYKWFVLDKMICIADLGEVSKLTIEDAREWRFSHYKVGYQNQEYDKLNGRMEFNTTNEFLSPLDNVLQSEKSFISKYRADSFGIQWLRWDFLKKDSKDNRSDNDMFFIAVMNNGGKLEVDRRVETFNKVSQKGLFNHFLSPKRNLLRNGNLLASYMHKVNPQAEIEFTSSEKVDSDMSSHVPFEETPFIREKDNVKIWELCKENKILFTPMIFKFYSKTQFSVPETMTINNPLGYVRFTYKEIELKGFILEVSEADAMLRIQQVTVLAHPDTPTHINRQIFNRRDAMDIFVTGSYGKSMGGVHETYFT